MDPQITLNWAAIGVAVVASFIFGFVWYTPLFGKAWAKEMGFPEDMKPDQKEMMKGMALMVLGSLLTAFVLAHSTQVWRGSVWGSATPDKAAHVYGFFAGFFTFVGFYLPMLFNTVTWEQKSWKLFGINAAYHFLSLQLVAHILSAWR